MQRRWLLVPKTPLTLAGLITALWATLSIAPARGQPSTEPPPPPEPPAAPPGASPPVPPPPPAAPPPADPPQTPPPTPPPASPSASEAEDPDSPLSPSFTGLPRGPAPDATVTATRALLTSETVAEAPRPPGWEALPGTNGSVGLLRLSAAEVGAVGQFRVGLFGEYFSASDFLVKGDRNLRLQGSLGLGYTPLPFLEVFGAIAGSANRNRRICDDGGRCTSEAGRRDPEVIKAYGDILLGTKLAYPVARGMRAGGEVGLRFLSSVSDVSFDPGATSVWLTGLGSWDLQKTVEVPLRVHANLGLFFDNSPDVQDLDGVTRPTRVVTQFAYGVAHDRVRMGLGVERPFTGLAGGMSLYPFAEYHLDVVLGGGDPAFADFQSPRCGGDRPCLDNRDQHWITLGLRSQTKSGLSLAAGVDLALRSLGFPFGSPLPPFNLLFGVSHPLEFGRPKVVTRTMTVEKRLPPEPLMGHLSGKVISAGGGAPVEGAVVGVAGRGKSRVATDPDGGFRTPGLPAGPVELSVSAPEFEAGAVRAEVVAGQETPLVVTLTPQVKKTKISGRLTDEKGRGVPGALVLSGPEPVTVKADPTGAFTAEALAGTYTIRVEADRHLTREMKATLEPGQAKDLSTSVRSRPASPRVVLRGGRLVVRVPVSFRQAGSEGPVDLSPGAQRVLDEVVDALLGHPEVRRVRVEAHWDSGAARAKAQELTEQQARAVVSYLVAQGVSADRLEAAGMGAQKPVVPNIGAARLRNRRVEFHVVN